MSDARHDGARPGAARTPARRAVSLAAIGVAAVAAAFLLGGQVAQLPESTDPQPRDNASGRALDASSAALPSRTSGSEAQRTALAQTATGRFGPSVPWRGRTASVVGTITRVGLPAPDARIEFTSGANAGIELLCDADGRFASPGLYPGLGVITVRSGNASVTRELELPRSRQKTWDLDFVAGPRITGRITAADGAPIADARVRVDGQATRCDGDGWFGVHCQASGDPLLQVDAAGFVPYRESLRGERQSSQLEVELATGCQLTVSLAPLPGVDGGMADVYLVPLVVPFSAGGRQASFPWHDLYPVRVAAGGSRVLDGLPGTRFDVFAFHESGKAVSATVWVRPEAPADVVLEWAPMPTLVCTVTRGGEPVADAAVSILYADPFRATMRQLGAARKAWRSQPLRILPGVAGAPQSSDRNGGVQLSRWGDRRDPGFLVVEAPGLVITRPLTADDVELTLDLDDPVAASTPSPGRLTQLRRLRAGAATERLAGGAR